MRKCMCTFINHLYIFSNTSHENLEKLVAKENLNGPKNILIFLVWVVKYEPGIS